MTGSVSLGPSSSLGGSTTRVTTTDAATLCDDPRRRETQYTALNNDFAELECKSRAMERNYEILKGDNATLGEKNELVRPTVVSLEVQAAGLTVEVKELEESVEDVGKEGSGEKKKVMEEMRKMLL